MRRCIFPAVLVSLSMLLAAPASALEYTVDAPEGANFGKPTSIDVVQTADGGAAVNEDRSKNAALSPPAFGSNTSNLPNSGDYLTPNLAPGGQPVGTVIGGGSVPMPPQDGGTFLPSQPSQDRTGFTEVTSDLYYSGGYLGTLKIPAIDLNVKIYEGTGSSSLAKGAGHFEDTSIWAGNVALAGHNRGVNNHFGEIHTLDIGDTIKLTTKLGTRTYEVVSVSKVSETDRSALAAATDNCITLYTCVRNQSDYRWCVQGVERTV